MARPLLVSSVVVSPSATLRFPPLGKGKVRWGIAWWVSRRLATGHWLPCRHQTPSSPSLSIITSGSPTVRRSILSQPHNVAKLSSSARSRILFGWFLDIHVFWCFLFPSACVLYSCTPSICSPPKDFSSWSTWCVFSFDITKNCSDAGWWRNLMLFVSLLFRGIKFFACESRKLWEFYWKGNIWVLDRLLNRIGWVYRLLFLNYLDLRVLLCCRSPNSWDVTACCCLCYLVFSAHI